MDTKLILGSQGGSLRIKVFNGNVVSFLGLNICFQNRESVVWVDDVK